MLASAYFVYFLSFTGHLELSPLLTIKYKLKLKMIFIVSTLGDRLLLWKNVELCRGEFKVHKQQ